jgi:hypothetical protein
MIHNPMSREILQTANKAISVMKEGIDHMLHLMQKPAFIGSESFCCGKQLVQMFVFAARTLYDIVYSMNCHAKITANRVKTHFEARTRWRWYGTETCTWLHNVYHLPPDMQERVADRVTTM